MIRYGMVASWVVACSGSSDEATPTEPSDPTADTATEPEPEPAVPTLTASFAPATVTAGESATLEVVIEDYVVVDPTAAPPPAPAEGEGHYHVYLDGVIVVAAWTPSVTIATRASDAPGDRVFRVTLVDSAHAELDPPVDAEVTLTIE